MLNRSLKPTCAVFSVAGMLLAGTQAYGVVVLTEDFELPSDVTAANSDGNTNGTLPDNGNWLGATQGFGSTRRGIIDETSLGYYPNPAYDPEDPQETDPQFLLGGVSGTELNFTDPTGEQAFAFRYTNSGLMTAPSVIGNFELGTTYTISFDVVLDRGRNDSGTSYRAELVALPFDTVLNTNGGRQDIRGGRPGTILTTSTGNATLDGLYTTISFDYTLEESDPLIDPKASALGQDIMLRFIGATSSATIDNIIIDVSSGAIPGDTDGDGDVDDADLGTSFANYTGPGGTGKTAADGDTDGDGDVDDGDLGVSFAGYTGPLGPAVPEPASLALLGLGSLMIARRRRA